MSTRLLLIIAFVSTIPLFSSQKMTLTEKAAVQGGSQREAERLWEQAISAKGGRTRLHQVRNLVVSSRATYRLSLFKRGQLHYEEFYVFPSKMWAWYDDRPSVLGLYLRMFNFDDSLFYETQEGSPPKKLSERNDGRFFLLRAQLVYLMETRWVKPIVVGMTRGHVGHQDVDIIQTLVNERRIDFALDRESHLPVKISIYPSETDVQAAKRSGGVDAPDVPINSVLLSDYIEVDGIKMPRVVNFDRTIDVRTSYLFNVTYDERIFKQPPSIEAGPEAWRARRE
ncbi:hypothetical protein [Pyrinomonas methylaliphatogenes]|uniref:Outer membrane lipoprotein-sorting protein n=1 Tax=Pyrinomonas methylaliphatogenes TaxID=454194 RepID=A0A0B6X2I6_9BACT|nr:hypothetical protein [Pyrinomonas methylaliphatogenes]CDM67172.1 hypothetical protein PYK22_03221 [Pyrinomonas methylaliphatogenes]